MHILKREATADLAVVGGILCLVDSGIVYLYRNFYCRMISWFSAEQACISHVPPILDDLLFGAGLIMLALGIVVYRLV